jgi:hypothetical protein
MMPKTESEMMGVWKCFSLKYLVTIAINMNIIQTLQHKHMANRGQQNGHS